MIEIRCGGMLFDMDGVLVDSTPAVARVWTQWAVAHGFIPADVVRQAHGRPSLATVQELLPNAPESEHKAHDRELERMEIADISDVVALPGALQLLRSLPATRWAVVTSATRALAQVRLRASGLPFGENLVTATDLQRGKPHPDPYLKGAEILKLAPKDCVVVEDAPSGVRAGKAAGARVLGLRTTSTPEELLAAGADWIAKDLSAVTLQPSSPNAAITLLLNSNDTK
jgi:mannitol-1-/sugar-/sorbitol-6-phosphatase